jgi:CheY-like chemotaxis protein
MSRILVVDDSMVIRKMINRSLEGSNHEVVQAENGQEGL